MSATSVTHNMNLYNQQHTAWHTHHVLAICVDILLHTLASMMRALLEQFIHKALLQAVMVPGNTLVLLITLEQPTYQVSTAHLSAPAGSFTPLVPNRFSPAVALLSGFRVHLAADVSACAARLSLQDNAGT